MSNALDPLTALLSMLLVADVAETDEEAHAAIEHLTGLMSDKDRDEGNESPTTHAKGGGTCKTGQRADLTKCTPAKKASSTPEREKGKKDSAPAADEPSQAKLKEQAKVIVGKVKPTKRRAFTGKPEGTPINPNLAGAIGEEVLIQVLKGRGFKDAQHLSDYMSTERNNLPADLLQDHEVIEAKTGQSANRPDAQKWRLFISKPNKKEAEMLAQATPEEKAAWNAMRLKETAARKTAALAEVAKKKGLPVKGKTMTVILNHDRRTADVYEFDGFHPVIRWNSEEAKAGYKGSYTYG